MIWVKKTIIYRFLPTKPQTNLILFFFFCEIIYFYRFFLPNCTILSCVFLARSQNIFIDFFLAKTQFYTPKVTNITYISLTDVVYIKGGVVTFGQDHQIVVRLTAICAISDYHHFCHKFNSKLVSDLVLLFPPLIELTATILLKYSWQWH